MLCPKCGQENADTTNFCSKCGSALKGQASQQEVSAPQGAGTRDQCSTDVLVYPRNPPLSPHLCWLNLIWPGIAQMVHGQIAKGVCLVVALPISLSIAAALWIFFLLPMMVVILSTIDAYKVGKTLEAGKPVGKWEWFPAA